MPGGTTTARFGASWICQRRWTPTVRRHAGDGVLALRGANVGERPRRTCSGGGSTACTTASNSTATGLFSARSSSAPQ
jgi:hypothetical protein